MKYLLAVLFLLSPSLVLAATPAETKAVDALFSAFGKSTPGCAVAVEQGGKRILTKAYGMADLELNVPNTPETVFEAGSVSKQFTAAAIAVLASQGKLSLDDDAHKYLPELPDYGAKLTLKHLLHHTSGMREWSDIVELEGWPRGTRAVSEDYAAEAIFRQKSLNFTPGTNYLYSNSNYVLLALVVRRVSGQSLEAFTEANLFRPVGMTHTGWRTDFTRIVPHRAQAYGKAGDGSWHLDMPFENVIGHAGLLTTVGDLMRWNEALTSPPDAFKPWVPMMTYSDAIQWGSPVGYALGLAIGPINGDKAISHTGSTAGYRAFLGRFPDQKLSIATLCNSATVDNGLQSAGLEEVFSPSARAQPIPPPKSETTSEWQPSAEDLAGLSGRFQSDEAGVTLEVKPIAGTMTLVSPSGRTIALRPLTRDHFISLDGKWKAAFSPDAISLSSERILGIRFQREN